MIHRGVQYARAVQRFYRKNGRYPTSIEQLQNFNNIRYLRKRYKDPLSADGEWNLVHAADINFKGSGAQVGTVPDLDGTGHAPDTLPAGSPAATTATTSSPGLDADGLPMMPATGSITGNAAKGNPSQAGMLGGVTGSNDAANGQVLGGGDVYGVVSKSKKAGIHSFGEKSKYNEWFFVYATAMDRGQLLVGPYNPKMFFGGAISGLNSPKNTVSNSSGNLGTTK
jgi:hypothetical protein